MSVKDFSTTPASNATVGSITWAEGQAPSSVNDSARQLMADIAEWYANVSGGLQSGVVGGTADAITLTTTPTHIALAVNQQFLIKATGANTVTTPTLNVSALGAKTIKLPGGGAVVASQWATNAMLLLVYDGTDMILLTPPALTGAALLAAANTFTAAQAITAAALALLTVTSTDAGATEGPIHDLYRDSASPAANDIIAAIYASGRSSTAVKRQYGKIISQILDATNASEDAVWLLQTIVAGTLATRATLGQGLLMAGATGGDPGGGKINATDFQINGASMPFTKEFTSADQAIGSASSLTLAHGLGAIPKLVAVYLVCQTSQLGYTTGDIVAYQPMSSDGATVFGSSITVDATNLSIRLSTNTLWAVIRADTGATANVTAANWKIRYKAWA